MLNEMELIVGEKYKLLKIARKERMSQ